jgi:hypothetical protein
VGGGRLFGYDGSKRWSVCMAIITRITTPVRATT